MLVQLTATAPPGTDWLGPAERSVLAALALPRRRRDWTLGRWAAKAAVLQVLPAVGPAEVQILAGEDGAPEAWVGSERAALSLSITHRDGMAAAAVARLPAGVGCDLELAEPREPAFLAEWFSAPERELVESGDRELLSALLWSAKESCLKLTRTGLRRDPRALQVSLEPAARTRTGRLAVLDDGCTRSGWWRLVRPRLVLTVLEAGAGAG